MVKKRKLFQKILSGSKNIRFDDLITVIQAFGFIYKRTSGSHQVYKHPNVPEVLSLQPTKDGKIKTYQLRQFLAMIEEYSLVATFDDYNDQEEDE
jgi:predicted RNA binding protein YcfA (HicA-like mRNA interferase family)